MSMFTGNSTILALSTLLLFRILDGQSEEYSKILNFCISLQQWFLGVVQSLLKNCWEVLRRFMVNV